MNLERFRKTLDEAAPDENWSLPLQALWWQGKGDWEQAHEAAQEADSPEGDWVHAHLHRVEGDLANAGYWYTRAGQEICDLPVEKEWEQLVRSLSR